MPAYRQSPDVPSGGERTRRKALLDELVVRVPEAIVLLDPDGRILSVNPEFTKIFGYAEMEALGRRIDEVVVPDGDCAEPDEYTSRGTPEGTILNVETVRKRKDGTRVPVSILGVPVSNAGGQTSEYLIYRDITERKRAEARLRPSEESLAEAQRLELQQIVDLVPQFIIVLEPDGKCTYANRVARDYTGLSLEVFRGPDVIARIVHPEDLTRVRPQRQRGLAGSEPFEVDGRMLGKDGVYRWFFGRYNPLIEGEQVIRWYMSATEFESRKQEEERVRKENVRLEERNRIAQELHDTLLQTVMGASLNLAATLYQLSPDSTVKPRLERVLELMNQGVKEGRDAIQGLRASESDNSDLVLALSRIRQQFVEVQPDIEFRVTIAGPQKQFPAEIQHEIYRIGREALVNAFSHSGAKRVDLELEYSGCELQMWIRDNGRGIEADLLEQGRDGHWGLAGMRERASRIGGRLKILSRAPTGTEIQLSVPLERSSGQQSSG